MKQVDSQSRSVKQMKGLGLDHVHSRVLRQQEMMGTPNAHPSVRLNKHLTLSNLTKDKPRGSVKPTFGISVNQNSSIVSNLQHRERPTSQISPRNPLVKSIIPTVKHMANPANKENTQTPLCVLLSKYNRSRSRTKIDEVNPRKPLATNLESSLPPKVSTVKIRPKENYSSEYWTSNVESISNLNTKNVLTVNLIQEKSAKVSSRHEPREQSRISESRSRRSIVAGRSRDLNIPSNFSSFTKNVANKWMNESGHEVKRPFVNTQCCLPVVGQVISHLLAREKQTHRSMLQVLIQQIEINSRMRQILYDWLVSLSAHFGFRRRTVMFTFHCIEVYVRRRRVLKEEYQLLGTAALFMASKYEEIYPPKLDEFAKLCNNYYPKERILETESRILMTMNFELTFVLPFDFFEPFAIMAKLDKDAISVGYCLLTLAIFDNELSEFLPSYTALSVCMILCRIFDLPQFHCSFVKSNESLLSFDLHQGNFSLDRYFDEKSSMSLTFKERDVLYVSNKIIKLLTALNKCSYSGVLSNHKEAIQMLQSNSFVNQNLRALCDI